MLNKIGKILLLTVAIGFCMPTVTTASSLEKPKSVHSLNIKRKITKKQRHAKTISKVLHKQFFKHIYERGIASYYGADWNGRRTSSGVRFDTFKLTAAHKYLPFGTQVLVKNLKNGKSVIVKILDRGPFHTGRIIDLSYAAKRAIGMSDLGMVALYVR